MSLDLWMTVDVDTGGKEPKEFEVYETNYTHNCSRMAREAGFWEFSWGAGENDAVKCAGDMIEPLKAGLAELQSNPAKYKAMNPENGWGDYDSFCEWTRRLLAACIENPKAKVRTWR